MSTVTRLEWTYHTSGAPVRAADSQVRVEVFRDGELVAVATDEPGAAGRLARGGVTTRSLTFSRPSDGRPPHAGAEFPEGVRGHLDVRFRVHGYDAWRIDRIESTVVVAEPAPGNGTAHWVESRERYVFPGVGVLRAEPCEGTALLDLSY